jgi:hypothetical protein
MPVLSTYKVMGSLSHRFLHCLPNSSVLPILVDMLGYDVRKIYTLIYDLGRLVSPSHLVGKDELNLESQSNRLISIK